VEPAKQWRLTPLVCPYGVREGVEDRVVQRASIVAFGVISVGHRTAFWEWLAGGGFHHVWTGSASTDITLKLKLVLIDVIFFDHTSQSWSPPSGLVGCWCSGRGLV
jgi:hypothetical protein